VSILDDLLPSYTTVNVLADHAIREGIKEYSSWPTVPQIYVEGEFIGGCDILKELARSGEIFDALKIPKPIAVTPNMHISAAAIEAFKGALEDAPEGEFIRLKVSANMAPDLSFGPRQSNDAQIEQDGVLLLIDAMSAARCDGLTIDFKTGAMGSGFEIGKAITVENLKAKMDAGEAFHLFDVRTREEWDAGRISGARLMLDVPASEIEALDKNATIVFQCRSGGRSRKVTEDFNHKGYRNAFNLTGGITAWNGLV
jgi:monothiol glutaredoxin